MRIALRSLGASLSWAVAVLLGPAADVGSTQPADAAAQTDGAVTPESVDRLLEKRATEMRAQFGGAKIARFVHFDVAWPRDADEYRALGKHAIVLIVAVSHEAKELPLRKVYLQAGRKSISLRQVWSRQRELAPDSVARTVLGAFRQEAFYLAPVTALLREGVLTGDFAVNRTGFRIGDGPFGAPDFIRADRRSGQVGKPAPQAVKALLEREYPGFPVGR